MKMMIENVMIMIISVVVVVVMIEIEIVMVDHLDVIMILIVQENIIIQNEV
jgi:hypothetical protein